MILADSVGRREYGGDVLHCRAQPPLVRWLSMRGLIGIVGFMVAALGFGSDASAATVSFKQYTNPSSETFRTFNKLYLSGVMEGLLTFNSSLISDGAQPLFCLPPKLAVTEEQAADIMMREANTIGSDKVADIPISILLLEGLKETFPCGAQRK